MRAEELASKSKKDLQELARKLDIGGRSTMSKEDLTRAILKASPAAGGNPRSPAAAKGAPASKRPGKTASASAANKPASNPPASTAPVVREPLVPRAPDPAENPAQSRAENPVYPARPNPSVPPPPPPLPPTTRDGDRGPMRPPFRSGRENSAPSQRRGVPPQDPAMKLSRVEEIRRASPGRPARQGMREQDNNPRDHRRPGGPPDGRSMHGRRDERHPQKGGPARGGPDRRSDPRGDRRGDRNADRHADRHVDRHGGRRPDRPGDPHSEERALQAREHLRRSGEARRGSGYTPQFEQRPREPRPPLEPPRPAPIPDRLAQSSPPSARPQRLNDASPAGHPVELPASYGIDRLVLMVRDPEWIHAYWEVTPTSIDRARAQLAERWDGHRWILRVRALPLSQSAPGGEHFDIEVGPGARNWYIQIPKKPAEYEGLIGVIARDGTFHPFARSNRVTPPRGAMSDVHDVEWTSTREEFEQIYTLSGGHATGLGSGASAELGEAVLEKHEEGWFSGMLGSMGSGAMGLPRHRGFWFQVNTELVLYGATEPDARVTVQGRPVALRPDGTFTLRFQLPDGVQEIPCAAVSADGISERTITPVVRRQTTSSEREASAPPHAEI